MTAAVVGLTDMPPWNTTWSLLESARRQYCVAVDEPVRRQRMLYFWMVVFIVSVVKLSQSSV